MCEQNPSLACAEGMHSGFFVTLEYLERTLIEQIASMTRTKIGRSYIMVFTLKENYERNIGILNYVTN